MSRRRRGFLLLGLALVLGGLAAADVSRREAALERRLGPAVPVVVARGAIEAGTRLEPAHLGVRRVPARFAPAAAFTAARELVGLRAAVAIAPGDDLSPGEVGGGDSGGPVLRRGERVADVVAVGSPDAVAPGSRVDVVVTREGEAGGPGRTELALEDVEVLASAPASEEASGGDRGGPPGAARVAASLRVTVRQAVFLAAAQSFAREVRLLPRAPGDRERQPGDVEVGQGLG
ncbi:MAG TPA: Flp pilus assembly protein CpaB [Solirubrobacteraceae bacterium]|nr:Flp pilus assembly protein CpaB [Solirubrobacteraceae bacterium]